MCLCVHVSMSPCVHVSICLCLHVSYLHVSLFASPDVGYCAVLLQPFPGEHVHLVWPQLGGWQKRPPHPLAPVYQSSLVLGIGSLQLSPLYQTAVGIISLNRSQIRSQGVPWGDILLSPTLKWFVSTWTSVTEPGSPSLNTAHSWPGTARMPWESASSTAGLKGTGVITRSQSNENLIC